MHLLRIEYTAAAEQVEAVRPAHRRWLADLLDRGLVLVGGPLLDHSGGLVILLHDDAASLERDLRDDPYLAAGVARHDHAEFTPTLQALPPTS